MGTSAGFVGHPINEVRAVGSLFSSTFWYELTEKYGLDSATAGRVASWAIATLEGELERRGAAPLAANLE